MAQKKVTKWLQIYTTRDYREKITIVAARGTREPRNARRAAGGAFPEGFPECEEGGWGRPGAGGPWNASRGAEGAPGAGSLGMQAEGLGLIGRGGAKPPKVHKQLPTTPGPPRRPRPRDPNARRAQSIFFLKVWFCRDLIA